MSRTMCTEKLFMGSLIICLGVLHAHFLLTGQPLHKQLAKTRSVLGYVSSNTHYIMEPMYSGFHFPPPAESSLYGSPSVGLVTLSPTRPKKRRLALEKLPGSANGQTRLTFN